MAQQTVLEFLIKEIKNGLSEKGMESVFKQAKQMEKEQIIMAHVNGSEYSCDSAEQYYTETYGKD